MTTDRLFLQWYDKLDRLGGLAPQEKFEIASFNAVLGLVPANDYTQKQAVDHANDGKFRKVIGLGVSA